VHLTRPYIPLWVREVVIDRQAREVGLMWSAAARHSGSATRRLKFKLEEFFAGSLHELHHRPALVNRDRVSEPDGKISYYPDANDPDHLIYLVAGAGEEHDVETRVRGQHGDYSDLAKARKRKRAERKARGPTYHWPKRKLRSANRWPKRGSRKFRSRQKEG
jgi:hypothetical protein